MKNIAVIFGGKSAEHDVSIITAHKPIIESLLNIEGFNVWPIYIAKDGSWYCDQKMNDLNYFKQENFENILAKEEKIELSFDKGLKIIWPGIFSKTITIDIAFPAMHGTYGEDGSLMGLLRMAGIPFVGCDLFASAVAMDKVLTKQVISAEGVPVVPYVWFTKYDWKENKIELRDKISKLKLPLFIKPVHLGSSIGITKVKNISELENAIEVAFHYDNKVLIEEGVENLIEVTLPIMGNTNLVSMANIERPLNNTEFFDFNDKYLSSGGKKGSETVNNQYSQIPAQIEDSLAQQVREYGIRTFKTLGCEGIARVDFLIDSLSKKVYVNEVNTLPGSLYAHNWKKSGVSNIELVSRLVDLALEKFEEQKNITYTFDSTILKQVGGAKN
jgi:D-alanine-D-alanine ligase